MGLWPIDEVLVMVDPNAAEDYYYAHNHLYSPTPLITASPIKINPSLRNSGARDNRLTTQTDRLIVIV